MFLAGPHTRYISIMQYYDSINSVALNGLAKKEAFSLLLSEKRVLTASGTGVGEVGPAFRHHVV